MSSRPFVIVVGIDYSTRIERALRAAFTHARKHAPAEVHVAHVAPPTADGEETFLGTSPLSLKELKDELAVYLGSFLRKLSGAGPGGEVRDLARGRRHPGTGPDLAGI